MISSPRARLEASLLLDSLAVHRPKRVNSSHGVTKTGAEGRSAPRLASSRRPDGAGRLMNGSFLAESHSAHRPLFFLWITSAKSTNAPIPPPPPDLNCADIRYRELPGAVERARPRSAPLRR
jgi:hypothetical protein